MRLRAAVLYLVFLSACGGEGGPVAPGPLPTPDPIPTPTPAPLWPRIAYPLRVSGDQFVDASGRVVWRFGAWDLYGSGWTVPPRPIVVRLADAGVNTIGVRLGPQSPLGPDGVTSRPSLWPRVYDTLDAIEAEGVVAHIELFDFWVVQHGYGDEDFDFDLQMCDGPLTGAQKRWIAEVAENLRGRRSFVLVDGNETFKCHPTEAWSRALRDELRQQFPGVLLGTNSENRQIAGLFDFAIYHQDGPVTLVAGRPTGVSESGPDLSAEDWAQASRAARRARTFFDLWRSDALGGEAEWDAALRLHAEVRRASGM